ncbi:7264_t:CDS:1, partial [Scutellospora calospora]
MFQFISPVEQSWSNWTVVSSLEGVILHYSHLVVTTCYWYQYVDQWCMRHYSEKTPRHSNCDDPVN